MAKGTGTESQAGSAQGGNEGEGSRSADQHYREGVQRFLSEQDPAALGKAAEREVAAHPEEYRAAEAAGRERSAGEAPKDVKGSDGRAGQGPDRK